MEQANNEAKQFFKKYRLRAQILIATASIIITSLIIADAFLEFMDISVLIIIVALYAALVRGALFWYRMKRDAIITEELNPPKLNAVLNTAKVSKRNMGIFAFYHYYNGDYEEVIKICTYKLNNDFRDKGYVRFYDYLAGTYFELGDIEKLKNACDEFDRDIEATKSSLCPLMKYYRLYADGEYERLKEAYNDSIKDDLNNATRIRFEYIHAVNLCTLGEVNEAKTRFEDIRNKAPLLSQAKLSDKHIKNINSNKL